jgi:hypothetical protein
MANQPDAEPPDLEDLARRYLDLWQEHWAATAADPHASAEMARAFRLMAAPWAAPWAAWAQAWGAPWAGPGPGGGAGATPGTAQGAGHPPGMPPGREADGSPGMVPPGTDPAAALAAVMQAWTGAVADDGSARPASPGSASPGSAPPGSAPPGPASPGSATAAAAPGDGSGGVAERADRLAAVEARLDRLEAGLARLAAATDPEPAPPTGGKPRNRARSGPDGAPSPKRRRDSSGKRHSG